MSENKRSCALGKGEVESSILSGSTIFSAGISTHYSQIRAVVIGNWKRNAAGTHGWGRCEIRAIRSRLVRVDPLTLAIALWLACAAVIVWQGGMR